MRLRLWVSPGGSFSLPRRCCVFLCFIWRCALASWSCSDARWLLACLRLAFAMHVPAGQRLVWTMRLPRATCRVRHATFVRGQAGEAARGPVERAGSRRRIVSRSGKLCRRGHARNLRRT
ncbi:hypothetical protein K788_0002327 [Paraburkholderia caribensis MBA4]|uniref:Uncharacterized protein n=1 Tax=Paraburkholderia caribensis MBA4 TaxID=1323664 RepID=A0A0N7JTX4_9BURK|nr:hypothetical protein K788_0002327 [Paraburkholderia caribensis MBA4]